jgi:hypothetical protein
MTCLDHRVAVPPKLALLDFLTLAGVMAHFVPPGRRPILNSIKTRFFDLVVLQQEEVLREVVKLLMFKPL